MVTAPYVCGSAPPCNLAQPSAPKTRAPVWLPSGTHGKDSLSKWLRARGYFGDLESLTLLYACPPLLVSYNSYSWIVLGDARITLGCCAWWSRCVPFLGGLNKFHFQIIKWNPLTASLQCQNILEHTRINSHAILFYYILMRTFSFE